MLEIIKLISVLLTFLFITGCSNTKINPCNGDTKVYSSISMETDKKICFKSIDSYDLNYKNKPEIIIYGNLIFPKTKKDKIVELPDPYNSDNQLFETIKIAIGMKAVSQ